MKDVERLRFVNREATPYNALQVVFAVRRGPLRLLAIEPPQTRDGERSISPERVQIVENRAIRVFWPKSIAPGRDPVLPVQAPGEGLRVASAEFQETPTPTFADEGAAAFTAQPTTYADIFAWRDANVQPPYQDHKRFFNLLDRETLAEDPTVWKLNLTSAAPRAEALQELLPYLQSGFAKRRTESANVDPYVGLPAPVDLKEKLKVVSEIFQKGFEAFFPGTPGLDLEGIKDAFNLFPKGELMLLTDAIVQTADPVDVIEYMSGACQPNSGNFFLFAELADRCVAHNVHAAVWSSLLRALVHSQSVFAKAYNPNGFPWKSSQFGPKLQPLTLFSTLSDLQSERASFEAQTTDAATFGAARKHYACTYIEDPDAPCS